MRGIVDLKTRVAVETGGAFAFPSDAKIQGYDFLPHTS